MNIVKLGFLTNSGSLNAYLVYFPQKSTVCTVYQPAWQLKARQEAKYSTSTHKLAKTISRECIQHKTGQTRVACKITRDLSTSFMSDQSLVVRLWSSLGTCRSQTKVQCEISFRWMKAKKEGTMMGGVSKNLRFWLNGEKKTHTYLQNLFPTPPQGRSNV